MKAMVMEGARKSAVVDVPDLEPAAGQVLVKVKYTGVCMSEWHPWDEAKGGERIGHEPLGTVAALGAGVTGFQVGDKVTGLSMTPSYAEYCLCKQTAWCTSRRIWPTRMPWLNLFPAWSAWQASCALKRPATRWP